MWALLIVQMCAFCSSVAQKISCGAWNYTLIIKAYTDAGRTQVVQLNSEVRLNQRIWVELETNGLDGSMVTVVSDSCWATNQASPTSSPRHGLIINGERYSESLISPL